MTFRTKPAISAFAASAATLLLLTGCGASNPLSDPSKNQAQAPETYKAEFDTTAGQFVIDVRREWAPRGADRFYNLVKSGFYDNSRFFRVVPGFVVQWGIPASPAVAKAWGENTVIQDDPVKQSNGVGFVSFASRGPNSRTTQVFINLRANANLDEMGFSPFGLVTTGMDVVMKLHAGYGEGAPMGQGPDQQRITSEGEEYLAREFAKLDKITRARIIP